MDKKKWIVTVPCVDLPEDFRCGCGCTDGFIVEHCRGLVARVQLDRELLESCSDDGVYHGVVEAQTAEEAVTFVKKNGIELEGYLGGLLLWDAMEVEPHDEVFHGSLEASATLLA